MAEEQTNEEKKATSGIGRMLVMVTVPVVIAALAGFGTYKFVLGPMFEEPAEPEPTAGDKIPMTAVMVDFDSLRATVSTDDTEMPAILQYSVALTCSNQQAALLVQTWQQHFLAMLVELHDSKTRDELTDPAAKAGMLRRAKQEANSILQRVQEEPDPAVEIMGILYTEHTVIEL